MWVQLIQFFTVRPVLEIAAVLLFIIASIWAVGMLVLYIMKSAGISKIGPIELTKKTLLRKSFMKNSNDIMIILKKHAEMINTVRDIKLNVIHLQMRYVDSKSIECRGIMQKLFLKLVEDEHSKAGYESNSLVQNDDYRMYRLCLRILTEDLRDFYEECFNVNHLAEKTENEFRDYCHVIGVEVIQKSTDILNDLYQGKFVSRPLIYSANQKIIPDMMEISTDILTHAREVAIKAKNDVARLESEFDSWFANYTETV